MALVEAWAAWGHSSSYRQAGPHARHTSSSVGMGWPRQRWKPGPSAARKRLVGVTLRWSLRPGLQTYVTIAVLMITSSEQTQPYDSSEPAAREQHARASLKQAGLVQ